MTLWHAIALGGSSYLMGWLTSTHYPRGSCPYWQLAGTAVLFGVSVYQIYRDTWGAQGRDAALTEVLTEATSLRGMLDEELIKSRGLTEEMEKHLREMEEAEATWKRRSAPKLIQSAIELLSYYETGKFNDPSNHEAREHLGKALAALEKRG